MAMEPGPVDVDFDGSSGKCRSRHDYGCNYTCIIWRFSGW